MECIVGFVSGGGGVLSSRRSLQRSICSSSRKTMRTLRCVIATEKGSKEKPYKIAVLEGDGAGPELASMAVKVLRALEKYTDVHFEFERADFGLDSFKKNGSVLPEKSVNICKSADAVLRAPQGMSRSDTNTVLGHDLLRDELQLFAQLRPVKVYPQLASMSSFKKDHVNGVDVMIVREVSGGVLVGGKDMELESDDSGETRTAYTKEQVRRISDVALQIAEARSGNVVNVDKAYAIRVSAFWRKIMHEFFADSTKNRSDIVLTDMFIDDFCREVMLNPRQFDVIVTSNLFGEMLAEVVTGLAGPQRLTPSVWISSTGLHVCGPADIYNSTAYPGASSKVVVNPIAMIRSASMLLRYALDEPAAADLVQQALERTLEEYVMPDVQATGNQTVVNAKAFTKNLEEALEYMHQYEMVCDPEVCGE